MLTLVIASLLYISVPLPLPLSAILILVVDLGFDLVLALSYAYDGPENLNGLMKLPPRKPVNEALTARVKREVELGRPLNFWEKLMNPIEEEIIVDSGTLSWAYLETAIIMTGGCLVCYFFAVAQRCGASATDLTKNGAIWGYEKVTLGNGICVVLIL